MIAVRFMDPMIADLLNKLGLEAGKQAIQAIIREWEERRRRKVDAAKRREIAAETVSMIQAATMEDVKEFSPIYQAVRSRSAAKKAAPKKAPGPAPGKRAAYKKAAPKWVATKKAAVKRAVVKKATKKVAKSTPTRKRRG